MEDDGEERRRAVHLPYELTGPEQARINYVPTPEVKTWRNSLPLTEVTQSTPMI